MKWIFVLFIFLFVPLIGRSQQITLVTPLQDSIKETSGLIYLNQKIITHNDSSGEPALYELDSTSGSVTRKVVVSNASNVDWEDLCYDDTYIYIADFGNNNGTRTDLKVYRISILDYFMAANDTVTADTIHFNYSDQTDFSSNPFATNFDAEAIISWNDSLYIFTKNWGNNWTNIYRLPNTPGTYQVNKIDSINSQGLVTGATFNSNSNTIMLSGYAFSDPFIIDINNITNSIFSNGVVNRYSLQLPSGFSYQLEGIGFINQNQYYVSTEESFSGNSGLFRLDFDNPLRIETLEKASCIVYPNPASDIIYIDCQTASIVEIYDLQGRLQKTSINPSIRISDLTQGEYVVIIKNAQGVIQRTEKLIIN